MAYFPGSFVCKLSSHSLFIVKCPLEIVNTCTYKVYQASMLCIIMFFSDTVGYLGVIWRSRVLLPI